MAHQGKDCALDLSRPVLLDRNRANTRIEYSELHALSQNFCVLWPKGADDTLLPIVVVLHLFKDERLALMSLCRIS